MKRAIRNSFIAKVLSLALFILVIFPTIPAYSSTIDQVLYDSYTPGIGGGGYQPFLLFDSSLETLNRVDVTIDISSPYGSINNAFSLLLCPSPHPLHATPAGERLGGIGGNREEEDQEVTLPRKGHGHQYFYRVVKGGNTK